MDLRDTAAVDTRIEQTRQTPSATVIVFLVESLDVDAGVKEDGSAFCVAPSYFITCAHVVKQYDKNKDQGVEIIGLAYENKKNGKTDFDYAKSRVKKMKEKYNVNYDFVIAGTSSSKEASESLPMLNKVMAFPTTIFIDKKGKVRKIHTGFSGPATGKYHEEYVNEFNSFMKELISE